MTLRTTLYRWDTQPLEKVTEMVARKAVNGLDSVLTQSYFKKGTLVPKHAQEGEMLLYVLQGAIRVQSGPEDTTVREGEVLVIPAGLIHQCECLDDTFVLTFNRDRAAASSMNPVAP